MLIYLVRHGKTEWNMKNICQGQLDSPLTEEGIRGAVKLSKELEGIKFDKIYSSDLYRAEHTARLIKANNEISRTKILREIDIGSWGGRNFDDIKKENSRLFNIYLNNPEDYKREDGESLYDVMDRAKEFLDNYIINKDYDNVLVVTHGVLIIAILNIIENIPIEKFWDNNVVKNTEINLVKYENNKFEILIKAKKNNFNSI